MFLYETCFHPRSSKSVITTAAKCLSDILARWDLPAVYLYTKRIVRLYSQNLEDYENYEDELDEKEGSDHFTRGKFKRGEEDVEAKYIFGPSLRP